VYAKLKKNDLKKNG